MINIKKLFILGAVLLGILFMLWLSYGNTKEVEAVDVCPSGNGWVKVEPLSGKSYTYNPPAGCTVTENCYKHATYVHYGSGPTVIADFHCTDWAWYGCRTYTQYDLSHASFKLSCVQPTVTVTPTEVPEPTSTPTPTDVPSCEVKSWSCEECHDKPTDDICYEDRVIFCGQEYQCSWGATEETRFKLDDWSCEVSCSQEPTPTQAPRIHVPGPQEPFVIPEYHAPVCTTEVPSYAVNPQYQKTGEGLRVTWDHNGTNITKWSVNYGMDRDDMPYGVPYLPSEAREITLKGLTWTGNTWIAVCGYNTNECQSCIVFDP